MGQDVRMDELPPQWTAEHDQLDAELRDLVKPVVVSILAVRDTDEDNAAEQGLALATELAQRIGPMPVTRVTELLFLALTKIANNAIERYDERLEQLHAQHLASGYDARRGDPGRSEERERGGTEPLAEE